VLKVLAYAEAGITTGFSTVARGIMERLNEDSNFDITLMGIGYQGRAEVRYPFPVYPASLNPSDQLGCRLIEEHIKRHRPDVIWILHDLWQINTYMAFRETDVPTVCYFPVDCPNLKWSFTLGLGKIGGAACYTQFGAREAAAGVRSAVDVFMETAQQNPEVAERMRRWIVVQHPMGKKPKLSMERLQNYQNPDAFRIIPHGLDAGKFGPMDRIEARKTFNLDPDLFIVGSINANQFRKRQDLVVRAFALLAAAKPNARLLFHCAGTTIAGWDLQQLTRYYGVHDRVFFVHESKEELTDSELNTVYNCCDVMLNLSGGEGWGLTSMESAACGIPQVMTDWGTARELWQDHAVLVPVLDYRMEPKFLNTCHAIADVRAAGDILIDLAENEEKRYLLGQRALTTAARQWSWDQVGDLHAELIRNTVAAPDPRHVSLNDCIAARRGDVRSALAGQSVWLPTKE
jgi:glycosyltransferase involved in cell wall biosynthesis